VDQWLAETLTILIESCRILREEAISSTLTRVKATSMIFRNSDNVCNTPHILRRTTGTPTSCHHNNIYPAVRVLSIEMPTQTQKEAKES
jgi:hypothetical protein